MVGDLDTRLAPVREPIELVPRNTSNINGSDRFRECGFVLDFEPEERFSQHLKWDSEIGQQSARPRSGSDDQSLGGDLLAVDGDCGRQGGEIHRFNYGVLAYFHTGLPSLIGHTAHTRLDIEETRAGAVARHPVVTYRELGETGAHLGWCQPFKRNIVRQSRFSGRV